MQIATIQFKRDLQSIDGHKLAATIRTFAKQRTSSRKLKTQKTPPKGREKALIGVDMQVSRWQFFLSKEYLPWTLLLLV